MASSLPATPASWTAGQFVTATELQTLTNWITYLGGVGGSGTEHPYAFVYLAGSSSLSAGVTTAVALDTEFEDTDSMHTGSNAYFTVNTPGVYHVIGQVGMPTGATSTHDAAIIEHAFAATPSTFIVRGQNDGEYPTSITRKMQATVEYRFSTGDLIQLAGFSTPGGTVLPSSGSGTTLVTPTWMSARFVRA